MSAPQKMTLKVLLLNFASTNYGPLTDMTKEMLEAAKATGEDGEGVETTAEMIFLKDVMDKFTDPREGVIPDHLKEVVAKMLEADVIIFGTPVYWSWPTARVVDFFTAITPLEADFGYPLRGKVAAVVTHCREDGAEKVVGDVMVPLRHLGFVFGVLAGVWRNSTGARFSEAQWQLYCHTHVTAPNAVRLALALKKEPPKVVMGSLGVVLGFYDHVRFTVRRLMRGILIACFSESRRTLHQKARVCAHNAVQMALSLKRAGIRWRASEDEGE